MARITYRVQEAPTGLYRSFQHRGWPLGYHVSGSTAVSFSCVDDYVPAQVREGRHSEITVHVAQPTGTGTQFNWRRLRQRAATLDEAKQIAARFFDAHPDWVY